jgi:hypothetical protein
VVEDAALKFTFRAKGNKLVQKEVNAPRLAEAVAVLLKLPGRRLFQYRDDAGEVQAVKSAQVNQFLRQIAGAKISLKDFRTLLASAAVLEALARVVPATSARRAAPRYWKQGAPPPSSFPTRLRYAARAMCMRRSSRHLRTAFLSALLPPCRGAARKRNARKSWRM